jgi:tetratricopeptide (TPR) repeat protein
MSNRSSNLIRTGARGWLRWLVIGAVMACSGVALAGLTKAEEELNKGVKLIVQNKAAEALPHLRAAVAADANLTMAHYNLGVALKITGKFNDAIAEYRKAYSLATSASVKAQSLWGVALSFEGAGKWQDAAEAWIAVKSAISSLPNESRLSPIVESHLKIAQNKK